MSVTSYGEFHVPVSPLVSCDSLYSSVCLSNYGTAVFPSVLPSLTGPRGVDFSVNSAFYLFGWCANFQASYIQNYLLIDFKSDTNKMRREIEDN